MSKIPNLHSISVPNFHTFIFSFMPITIFQSQSSKFPYIHISIHANYNISNSSSIRNHYVIFKPSNPTKFQLQSYITSFHSLHKPYIVYFKLQHEQCNPKLKPLQIAPSKLSFHLTQQTIQHTPWPCIVISS